MFNKNELERWLTEIGSRVTTPVRVYLIGGGALSFKGIKASTKDIDLVVRSREDFDLLNTAIKKSGYKLETDLKDEFYLTALAVYTKKDSRIDVFLKNVGKMLRLTDGIKKRAKYFTNYGNLTVYLVSNEDIFLFKTMAPRQADIFDCDRLMKESLDYDIIYNEILEQSKDKNKWFFWSYEKICLLENHNGVVIPIKTKLFSLIKKHWDDRPLDFMDDIDELDKHIPNKNLLKDIRV